MKKIKQHIFQSEQFRSLAKSVAGLTSDRTLVLNGVAGSLLAFVAASVYEHRDSQIVVVASDADKAERLRDDCALLLGEEHVHFLGTVPQHHVELLDMTSPIARIETLKALAAGARILVVASPESIIESTPPKETFLRTIIELKVGAGQPFQGLIDRLNEIGFEKKDFVEGYGDIAVRGGIVDVFPFIGDNPIRIEFFGDTIESIREFDVLSQRSIRELKAASIVPALASDSGASRDFWEGAGQDNRKPSSSLFDYLGSGAVIVLDEPAVIEREVNEHRDTEARVFFDFDYVSARAKEFCSVVSTAFSAVSVPVDGNSASLDFLSTPQPAFNGSVNLLVDGLKRLAFEGYRIYLTSDTKEEAERLKELIEEVLTAPGEESTRTTHGSVGLSGEPGREPSGPPPSAINFEISTGTFHSGFIFPPAKVAIVTEHEVFARLRRRGAAKRRRLKGFTQKELHQLRQGDYVVHVDHGIGTFAGLTKIEVGGVEQEVMKLLYLENDMLYVNLSFVNRVQKYSSQEGHVPKLSRLGGEEWERMKARAKRRIKDIARDLIALYARRKHEKGTAFSPDTHWQKELEASFMYEDTPDQAQATLDVKRDMENTSPMDHLICGDVGFGKTEVAVRAAFKAVMDGKQVAVLVPTTILALQHYNTFQDRLSRYTVRVENITRFKSAKLQKTILEQLKSGGIDIIIGTHRLLSGDIALKDLGLLIVDEEHRFGVAAKEKLRRLKTTVDTLALTATPIPRTLHFSLIGARDLSLIATPPRNRLPITTEIIPADFGEKHAPSGQHGYWEIVHETILKELHRGGQVYFVHDRVSNIEAIARQVQLRVPESRVHIAHGQMPGHALEKVMLDFLEKKYDVLICTKIIESGIDIPSVNTIIINRADRFGLAELYQLRGRVGRSNVQAYAYLLTPPLGMLPKATLRRLQAIEEFTELGSGFNLAMRDLEIRGAGNLLGAEQSGFIMEMGFEMYERILREAVEEVKREEFKDAFRTMQQPLMETVVDADIDALIPDFYIESDTERLDVYRRLYRAVSDEELQKILTELRDRFGEYPEEVENLAAIVSLRSAVSHLGFPKVSLRSGMLTLTLPDQSDQSFYGAVDNQDAPFQRMMKCTAQEKRADLRFEQAGQVLTVRIVLAKTDGARQRLSEAKRAVGGIAAMMRPQGANAQPRGAIP